MSGFLVMFLITKALLVFRSIWLFEQEKVPLASNIVINCMLHILTLQSTLMFSASFMPFNLLRFRNRTITDCTMRHVVVIYGTLYILKKIFYAPPNQISYSVLDLITRNNIYLTRLSHRALITRIIALFTPKTPKILSLI